MTTINPNIQELVKQAEAMGASANTSSSRRRSDHRFLMGGAATACTVRQPGGTVTEQQGMLIDLSASGGQIIYPGYIHPNSGMTLVPTLIGRRSVSIDACTVWCRLLSGRHHLVGFRARAALPIRDLVGAEDWLAACAQDPDLQTPIAGRMLALTDDPMLARSLTLHLSQTKVECEPVATRGALLDHVARGEVQMLAIDADGEDANASEVLAECRARSFEGPVVLISADREAEFLVKMDTLGRSEFVQVPIREGALVSAIRQVVREHPECLQSAKPIYSDLPECPDRAESLADFIESARLTCEQATAALQAEDIATVEKTIASLARHGGSYGYPDLTSAATRVLESIEHDERKVPAQLSCLAGVIARLQSEREEAA